MGITRFGRATTPTGRAVDRTVRNIRTKSAVGKIVVAVAAEFGGAIGDGAHRVFAGGLGSECGGAWNAEREGRWRSRDERARQYAAEALREQQDAGRRAEEAYRDSRQRAAGQRAPRAEGAAEACAGPRRERACRYKGRAVADYYEVLEVSPRARQSVIDKAYRALMAEDHPDRGGDTRRAQSLNEAYEVLGDLESRRRYDAENGLG